MNESTSIEPNIIPLFPVSSGSTDAPPQPAGTTIRELNELYLNSLTGAKALKPATQRMEVTRLEWWTRWNGDLTASSLVDTKVDEFIAWRRAEGNHSNGREGEPLHPATLDLHVISQGNANLWGVLNGYLAAVPFQRRGEKRGRVPTEVMRAIRSGELDPDEFSTLLSTEQVERLIAAIEKPALEATHPTNLGQLARAVGIARQNLVCYSKHSDFPKRKECGWYDVGEFQAFMSRHNFHPGRYGEMRVEGQLFDQREKPESRQLAADYLRTIAFGGGRRDATRNLLKADVLVSLNKIVWRRATQKAGHGHLPKKDFYLNLNSRLKDVVLRLLKFQPDSPWLFPAPTDPSQPISASALQRYLDIALEVTGIEDEVGETIGFHSFRHYFIATCVANPVNDISVIAEWVCHTTTEMIIRVYLRRLRPGAAGIMAQNLTF